MRCMSYLQFISRMSCRQTRQLSVFFPSYRFMEEVRETFERYRTEEMCCMMQEQNMNEQDREAFLQEFEAEREGSLAGFCVMGGIFSEGIDLLGEKTDWSHFSGNRIAPVGK